MGFDLIRLQDACKRDPASYEQEFMQQLQHFSAQLEIFKLDPTAEAKGFADLTKFLSHVRIRLHSLSHSPRSPNSPSRGYCVVCALIIFVHLVRYFSDLRFQVAQVYPQHCKEFPQQLCDILEK